jgi:hypothetical protein
MEEMLICQSCGMPMQKPEDFGTNRDGSQNSDYCVYCYKDGMFTQECTMEEMIQHNVQHLAEFNKDSEKQYSPKEAVEEMRKFFPTLKRRKVA